MRFNALFPVALSAFLCLSVTVRSAETAALRPTVYAWFPRDLGNWDTSAIDWSALTHLCFRAVVLHPDGRVTPGWGTTPERVGTLVKEAHSHGAKVTVLAWGTNAEGSSQYLANSPEVTVENLLKYVKAHNLDGVNVDDESWRETNTVTKGANRDLVTRFFHLLNREFKAVRADYHISYASPPVVSPDDKYNAAWIDYAAVADEIDAFAIMSYCMNPPTIGWTTGSQPVEGGGKVSGHARDFATVIDDYIKATGGRLDKILLGIGNDRGGHEWTCRGEGALAKIIGKPRKLTPEEARANAETHGRRFHPMQKTPWYCYEEDGNWIQGWYEDDESLAAKCRLARDKGIAGLCIWVLNGATEPAGTFKMIHGNL